LLATASFTLSPTRSITLSATNVASFTILAATSGNTLTYNGTISGPGVLTKTNSGTLVLGGSNAQVGGTAIHGGVPSVSADSNLGASSSMTFNGGTLLLTASIVTPRTVGAVGVGTIDTNFSAAFGAISGTGTIHKQGTGTVTFDSIKTGGVVIEGGDITIK